MTPDWRAIVRRHARETGVTDLPVHAIDELAAHLDDLYSAAVACGATPAIAESRALAALAESPLGELRQSPRRRLAPSTALPTSTLPGVSPFGATNMLHAMRLAARQFRHHPSFALVTILVLGLATGASVTVYTVLDTVLLRPLPYRAPNELVMLWDTNGEKGLTHEPISPVNFMDYRDLTKTFADAAAWWRPDVDLADPGMDPVRVRTIEASANLFSVLGVTPQLGPGFPAGGAFFDRTRLAVISDRLWRSRYHEDRSLIGKQLVLSGQSYTIAGVMPPRFDFPGDIDIWQRTTWDYHQHSRAAHFMEAVARLAPGVDVSHAQTESTSLAGRLEKQYASTNRAWDVRLIPLVDEQLGYYRAALIVLFGAVGLLMLIGCFNVASLLLTRAFSREREIAVRTAIGASPRHLIAQLLAEASVLSLAGAAVGTLVAALALPLIIATTPVSIPRLAEATLSWRALGFALALATATTMVFGLVPAIALVRRTLNTDLKSTDRGVSRTSGMLFRGLVAAEVALACALLIGAGLLVRTVGRMMGVPTGATAVDTLTANIQLPGNANTDWNHVAATYAALLDRVRQEPGVVSAGAANFLPFGAGWRLPFTIDGQAPAPAGEQIQAQFHSVTDGYFEAIGATKVSGRFFTAQDTAQTAPVVVVNETFAKRFLTGATEGARFLSATSRNIGPLGRNLMVPASEQHTPPTRYEIVGVIADVRDVPLGQTNEPAIYCPAAQYPFQSMFLAVRGRDRASAARAIQAGIRATTPSTPIADLATLSERFRARAAEPRLLMTVLVFFASLAAALAALGVYGLFSWTVALKRREIAIRLTLGARPAHLGVRVIAQGCTLAIAGLAIGWIIVRFAAHGIGRVLYEVSALDVVSTALAAGVLLLAVLIACVPPAIRAMRIDPVEGLRSE
jgi:predicted permease